MDWLCRSVRSGAIINSGPPLTVRTMLEALIKAYEIQGRFLISNSFNSRGMEHTVLVKLASTAVVSWLQGLSETQTLAAISNVWMDGVPLRTYRAGSNTIPRKGWAAGDACMRAVSLALLTRAGQPGSKTALTTPRWGFYQNLWGGRQFDISHPFGTWAVENVSFKVMPVEGHIMSAIEAALAQHAKLVGLGRSPSDIIKIEVRTNGAANIITNKSGILHNAADRDHCMQYSLAVALLKGDIPSVDDYQDTSPWALSQDVDVLRTQITIREDAQLTKDYLDPKKRSVSSGVLLGLAGGLVLEEVLVQYPVGHLKHPKTLERVREKFNRNMGLMFTNEQTSEIVRKLEAGGDMPISDFVDLLIPRIPNKAKTMTVKWHVNEKNSKAPTWLIMILSTSRGSFC